METLIHIFSLIPIPESGKEGIVHHDGSFTSWNNGFAGVERCCLALRCFESKLTHKRVEKFVSLLVARPFSRQCDSTDRIHGWETPNL